MQVPQIDPDMFEISKQIQERKKKEKRKQFLKDHAFDFFNSAIAFLALILSIVGLFFP